jgi:peptidylprolyl isomerase
MSHTVKTGDAIRVHYNGRLENGEMFDSSEGREPMAFTVGKGQLIKGFEDAVIGMAEGETKTVTISPDDAYGDKKDDAYVELPKDKKPEDLELELGMQIRLVDPQGQTHIGLVDAILDEVVRIDLNHPLAGKTLVFDIHVVGIDA